MQMLKEKLLQKELLKLLLKQPQRQLQKLQQKLLTKHLHSYSNKPHRFAMGFVFCSVRVGVIETREKVYKHLFTCLPARYALCGMGESNSQPQFGKLILYHLTNPAYTSSAKAVILPLNYTRISLHSNRFSFLKPQNHKTHAPRRVGFVSFLPRRN